MVGPGCAVVRTLKPRSPHHSKGTCADRKHACTPALQAHLQKALPTCSLSPLFSQHAAAFCPPDEAPDLTQGRRSVGLTILPRDRLGPPHTAQ